MLTGSADAFWDTISVRTEFLVVLVVSLADVSRYDYCVYPGERKTHVAVQGPLGNGTRSINHNQVSQLRFPARRIETLFQNRILRANILAG